MTSKRQEANGSVKKPPEVDEDTIEEVAEGVAATIYRARTVPDAADDGGTTRAPRWVAIKSATANRRVSPEPHDIVKEIALLAQLVHPNIIPFLGAQLNKRNNHWELYTPWVPYNLSDLLDEPAFSPHEVPPPLHHLVRPLPLRNDGPTQAALFSALTKSITYQLARALAFLHSRAPPVAARDVKPRNVLLTHTGRVQLVDLGIAYERELCGRAGNLWPEGEGEMYFDVATGPYRAPELLFGPRLYDALATDTWSFGATIAQFFTPVELSRRSSYDSDDPSPSSPYQDDNDDDDGATTAFHVAHDVDPKHLALHTAEWERRTLFDSTRGSIGLAWSIFKLRGTPDAESWPDFEDLPDANKLQFTQTPCVELRSHLPNLPPDVASTGSGHPPPPTRSPNPLDLVHRLLVYSPRERPTMADVLAHPWFREAGDILLPTELISSVSDEGINAVSTWHGESLGHWLRLMLRVLRPRYTDEDANGENESGL